MRLVFDYRAFPTHLSDEFAIWRVRPPGIMLTASAWLHDSGEIHVEYSMDTKDIFVEDYREFPFWQNAIISSPAVKIRPVT